MHRFGYPILALLCIAVSGPQGLALPAFPGAEGFGADTPGGRGGQVIYVDNLNDDGPGSLRAACEAEGPRMVLFSVSGVIELEEPLKIKEPFITIAGQSAPGHGICLKGYQVSVQTHDVVIRHLRIRVGDIHDKDQDTLTIDDARRVVIDHCSVSWSIDETLSVSGDSDEVTVQWCFITESLHGSHHEKGPHGYASLLRTNGGRLSFHHNLYAHHYSRNPRPGGAYEDEETGTLLDFRNNAIYDWGGRAGYSSDDAMRMNYVGNYLRPGPSTEENVYDEAFYVGSNNTPLYIEGNHVESNDRQNEDQWAIVKFTKGVDSERVKQHEPYPTAPVTTQTAKEAFDAVLFTGGASRPARDAVDERIVRQVRESKGSIIDSQEDVGGWPVFDAYPPYADTDRDGMPDGWERKWRFDPESPDDAQDEDGDGYTNLEEYLNGTVPRS